MKELKLMSAMAAVNRGAAKTQQKPVRNNIKPQHYKRDGAMECIEEMVLAFGLEETITFCKLNVWKYRYRAGEKNGEEDLKKADEYMRIMSRLNDRLKREVRAVLGG